MVRRLVLLAGLLAGLLVGPPARAQMTTQRYVGSFHHYDGPDEGNTMSHQYDLNLRRAEPGGFDYRLGMSLNYFSRPGETGVDLLRSRFTGELRDRRFRLLVQFTPWQDVSPRGDNRNQRSNVQLGFTPNRRLGMFLDYKRENRNSFFGRAYTDDAQARVAWTTTPLSATAGLRRLRTDSPTSEPITTLEARAGIRANQRVGRSFTAQETYDFVHTSTEQALSDRTYVTNRLGGTVQWLPRRWMRMGASGFLRLGRSQGNESFADSDIDERNLSGRIEVWPWDGLSLRVLREYRSRLLGDVNQTSDYVRWEGILRRPFYREIQFQAGILGTTDLRSMGGSVPATTAHVSLDGPLRQGIAGRVEVRASEPTLHDVDGLGWRELAQLRTNPSRESRLEVTWWHSSQPRIQGATQSDSQWEFIAGFRPGSGSDMTVSYRLLDGVGRLDRKERHLSGTLTWKAVSNTTVSLNGARRITRLGPTESRDTVLGGDLTFWLPREFRVKLTGNVRTGLGLPTRSSYGVTVDKTF